MTEDDADRAEFIRAGLIVCALTLVGFLGAAVWIATKRVPTEAVGPAGVMGSTPTPDRTEGKGR